MRAYSDHTRNSNKKKVGLSKRARPHDITVLGLLALGRELLYDTRGSAKIYHREKSSKGIGRYVCMYMMACLSRSLNVCFLVLNNLK